MQLAELPPKHSNIQQVMKFEIRFQFLVNNIQHYMLLNLMVIYL